MNSQPDAVPGTDLDRAPAAAFVGLRIERVEREDGSYVLYFSWPPSDAEGATARKPDRHE